ncbi:MAG TPA: hypothetical protein VM184_10785 [Gaiellaceae bacterium]|nr:hypothetical protein [Gaiellaceae bacterium]
MYLASGPDENPGMAAQAEFSDEFEQVAREEAERLRVRVLELRARSERWAARAHDLVTEAERLEARVRHLDELLGRAPQLRLGLQTEALQGQRLREEAVRILVDKRGTRQPIHYKEWYALLRDEGLTAVGKDPVATFLTQITRSPLVQRVDGRGGIYQVDPVLAYEQARQELTVSMRELTLAEDAVSAVAGENGEAATGVARVRSAQEKLSVARRRLDAILAARSQILRESLTAA